ncbi:putative peptidoglycan glycosyltransferase FtsW [Leptolyngbya sp. BC1307]|uniref:FtsW/RodA/SpoVE family cell cycle protein n=1 Tax=Leptolyngbya sp. BC1307 TaxID=2029589 RepID=UPI000EFB12C2|nr:putative peptidoglycan glycosyltransferase FtsW [Leptolyngbya sp. BC1307]
MTLTRASGIIRFFSVQSWALEARLLRWMTLLWLSVGMVVLFSASYPVAEADFNDGARYFKAQLIWVILGLLISRWITRHPLRQIMRLSGFFLLVCMLMVAATHIPGVGISVNGATRWLPLGPFLIQPSELMKPFLVMHSAQLFGKWHQLTNRTRLIWLGIFAGGLMLILAQPNLSTTAVCGIAIWLIAMAAGIPYRQLLITASTGLLAAVISVSIKSYQRDRITSFLNPWADPSENGYQLIQSLLAIGSGGAGGTGYGLSAQKIYFLPIQYTDFIFSVFAEEFGFIGCIMLLLFLAVYSTVALMVAIQAKKPVHRLVATGCMVLLVGQSLIHIGVAAGTLPTTGLPLPLFSYGGSSMIASLITAGVLIRVARESRDADVLSLPRSAPDLAPQASAKGSPVAVLPTAKNRPRPVRSLRRRPDRQ